MLSLRVARAIGADLKNSWQLLQLAAVRIAPGAFATLKASLPAGGDEQPYHERRQLDAARETLRMRRILHEEIHP